MLVLENILGPSAVTHYNKKLPQITIKSYSGVSVAEWSKALRIECLVIVVIRGFALRVNYTGFFFMKVIITVFCGSYVQTNFVNNKILKLSF